jgi:hypothetical protein
MRTKRFQLYHLFGLHKYILASNARSQFTAGIMGHTGHGTGLFRVSLIYCERRTQVIYGHGPVKRSHPPGVCRIQTGGSTHRTRFSCVHSPCVDKHPSGLVDVDEHIHGNVPARAACASSTIPVVPNAVPKAATDARRTG